VVIPARKPNWVIFYEMGYGATQNDEKAFYWYSVSEKNKNIPWLYNRKLLIEAAL